MILETHRYDSLGIMAVLQPTSVPEGSSVSSDNRDRDRDRGEWTESVVSIRRCAAVVKGGRRFSFNALVVVGNGRGQVAWGYGKANEVPPAVEKGVKDAHKQMNRVQLKGGTIPHAVIGKFGAARVLLMPAAPAPASSPAVPCGPSSRPPASRTS